MASKVRLRRKDIKQPDEFITLGARAAGWLRQHQQLAMWGGIGIALVVATVGVMTAYRAAQQRDANADLGRAMAGIGRNDAAASAELMAISTRWPGSGVARLAGLLAANAAIDGDRLDEAIGELERLQGEAERFPPFLRQQMLVAWGAALEMKTLWIEAAEKYKLAAAVEGPYAGMAMLGEARTRELGGQGERARELFRQVYRQFPDLPDREAIAAKMGS